MVKIQQHSCQNLHKQWDSLTFAAVRTAFSDKGWSVTFQYGGTYNNNKLINNYNEKSG